MRQPKKRAFFSLLTAFGLVVALPAAMAVTPAYLIGAQALSVTDIWNDIEVDLTALPKILPQRISVVDAAGKPYATFYSENRVPLTSLEQVSPELITTLLTIEDRNFYDHGPIDIPGTLRALARNATGDSLQGGSTLTQQYVKNLRLISAVVAGDEEAASAATEGTLRRKVEELKIAATLEKELSKDEILLGYLNVAYFGNGAYGIGAAARFYFDVDAKDLDQAQSALLVGLVKNPYGYDPLKRPEAAQQRRAVVTKSLAATGNITEKQRAAIDASPLKAKAHPLANGCTKSKYPYYCDWVKSLLVNDPAFGATAEERQQNLYEGGFTVHTALDPKAMKVAQTSVNKAFPKGYRVAAAVAVVEPGTGQVRAIAQTTSHKDTVFNYATQAQVQPGSTFKPITYAAALDQGVSPNAKLSGNEPHRPSYLNAPRGGFSNSDNVAYGLIDANKAMKHSVNTFFTRMTEKVGVNNVADMAYRLGMTSLNPTTRSITTRDGAITLGTMESTPLDVANVYATFAAQGRKCNPVAITHLTDADKKRQPGQNPACTQAIDPSIANTVGKALASTTSQGGTAGKAKIDRPAAAKTGTTNNHGATWLAGYTPQYSTAVWVGDPRGPSYSLRGITAFGRYYPRVYGGDIAAPIWKETMSQLHEGLPKKALPKAGPIVSSGYRLPDVSGLSVQAATLVLADAGFDVDVTETDSYAPHIAEGTVLSQSPAPGTTMATDMASVSLTVAK